MSQDREEFDNGFSASAGRASRGGRVKAIHLYLLLLVIALSMLLVLYAYPVALLNGLKTVLVSRGVGEESFEVLNTILRWAGTPVALLLGWALAALGTCGLLYAWLKSRPAAIAVTVVLAVLWIAGVLRHVGDAEVPEALGTFLQVFGIPPGALSSIATIVLVLGVLLLPVLWFLRPVEGTLARVASAVWFLAWLLLAFGLREVRAAVVLLTGLVAACTTVLLGFYLVAGFLLPIRQPGKEERFKILGFVRDYLLGLNYAACVVVDEPFEEDRVEKRIPGDALGKLATGPGFIISGCDHAVAVFDGFKFKGVQGPGVTFTGYGDRILQTVDLRPQFRAFVAETLTRDGIKVKVPAALACRIDSRGKEPRLGEPRPYSRTAAFKAVHAQQVEHGSDQAQRRTWEDLSSVVGEHVLQEIVGEYNFDDLYGPFQPGGDPPRKVIAQRFTGEVAARLKPLGIHLIGGGISDLQPVNPRIYMDRARSWQAEWARKTLLKQAAGQAEWLRLVERARAEAQADLILSLGRQLEELSTGRAEIRPEDAVRLVVSILEGLVSQQPTLGQLLPEETIKALADARKLIPE
jgi:hypothetical protein